MKKRFVLLSLLSLIICMPSFAEEYTPKKNPNFRAKAFSVSPKRKVYFTQGNLISQRIEDGDIAFMNNQYDVFRTFSSEYPEWANMHEFVGKESYLRSSRIVNGKMPNEVQYRCLTASEWEFILETRPKAAQLQSLAKVNDVNGYILLPDAWVLPAGMKFSPKAETYEGNIYTAEEWKKMELAGAIFLPASGYVYSWFGFKSVNEKGAYWTSSTAEWSNGIGGEICFDKSSNAHIVFTNDKDSSLDAIRLVYDVK